MKDLNLPVFKLKPQKNRILSMDQYLDFVEFNLKNGFDRESYRKWKKLFAVNVPFVISS